MSNFIIANIKSINSIDFLFENELLLPLNIIHFESTQISVSCLRMSSSQSKKSKILSVLEIKILYFRKLFSFRIDMS